MAPPSAARRFSPEEYAARLTSTRELMARHGLGTLCLVGPENVYYLTGLDHQGYFAFTMLVLPRTGRPLLVTRAMEGHTVAAMAPDCVHVPFQDGTDPAATAAQVIRDATDAGESIGVELTSTYLSVAVWERLRAAFGGSQLLDGSGLVDAVRAVQSPAEIEYVRRAARISDAAMQAGIKATHPGVNERDVAAAVYDAMIRAGGQYPGFVPLVRSRDILLHEHVTWRDHAVPAGDALFLELSGASGRYHAPCSRMVYLGRPPSGTDLAAGIALDGLAAVHEALLPGAAAGDVYAAWQKTVDNGLGHSRYRRHHCGYLTGIGYPPSWVGGSEVVGLRPGSEVEIRAGMVFHVLSWILDQDTADYVVSDTMLVTAAGGEVLTTTPRSPIIKGG